MNGFQSVSVFNGIFFPSFEVALVGPTNTSWPPVICSRANRRKRPTGSTGAVKRVGRQLECRRRFARGGAHAGAPCVDIDEQSEATCSAASFSKGVESGDFGSHSGLPAYEGHRPSTVTYITGNVLKIYGIRGQRTTFRRIASWGFGIHIGDDAVIDVGHFSLEGAKVKREAFQNVKGSSNSTPLSSSRSRALGFRRPICPSSRDRTSDRRSPPRRGPHRPDSCSRSSASARVQRRREDPERASP